ncbi:ferric reductase-like transmembrane domain-containing protein [Ahrensia sp. R2A130]|uniref:ferric reductase-like transmembrane domain-containing protein n=1 Tax=Ahrensia sp. R2A130 TaxID=744979 RepID=UPI0001E0CA3A|nr:ferric reductase-like transmembrane domain-containing protein [Ahrensia sp. R2A130]EFL87884.1 ferric reductase domain-containing protein [Ahrensia sp. R2A130]
MSAKLRSAAIWTALGALTLVPIALIFVSPYLPSRQLPYIVASVAGAFALAITLVQPLLAGGYLPGMTILRARAWHRWTGTVLIIAVVMHVGGLYLTSPMDAVDALLLVSPTPFSIYGVAAMWAVFITALFVALRRVWRMRPRTWHVIHNALALVIVVGTVVHALLIEGTMEGWSKWALSLAALAATAVVTFQLRVLKPARRTKPSPSA